jgi:4-amino-4-deoxy-L-arabinose transferase-like glycosyltransferase
MVFELTPQFFGVSYLATMGAMAIAFIIQLMMLFWNWKQSKVKDTSEKMLGVLEEIRYLLEKKRR